MNDKVWKKLWLLTLLANDVERAEADQVFEKLYGNQAIDLGKDPISEALMLLPSLDDADLQQIRLVHCTAVAIHSVS